MIKKANISSKKFNYCIMFTHQELCVIVDAFSSGKYLARYFKARGYKCLHIKGSPKLLSYQESSYIKEDFEDEIIHDGDINKTLSLLEKYKIKCLIPGMESGVELADTLSEQLKLPSNGTKLSRARRDKYEMVEVLGRENIPHVKHFKSNSLIEALEWVATVNKYPIVVKPIDSARTEGVKVCYSDKEIIDAFNLILGSTNFMGFPNNEVLLQTYLNGIEYMIDGVSVNGNHRITEIWRSTKKYQGGAYIYDLEELITYEGLEQSIIIPYVYNVLDALGIKFGPTHTEVMLTSDGPILIESGARLHGSIDPNAITDCMNTNHVELTVDSYIDPDNFQKQINSPYKLYKHCFCIALISESSGVIKSIPAINKIKSLPSYFSHMIDLKVGDYVKKTVDIVDCPGIIYLTHENRSVLKKDYQEIRRLEKSEFYDFM